MLHFAVILLLPPPPTSSCTDFSCYIILRPVFLPEPLQNTLLQLQLNISVEIMLFLTFSLHNQTLLSFSELFWNIYTLSCTLRSSSSRLLAMPSARVSTMGFRSFSFAAPSLEFPPSKNPQLWFFQIHSPQTCLLSLILSLDHIRFQCCALVILYMYLCMYISIYILFLCSLRLFHCSLRLLYSA